MHPNNPWIHTARDDPGEFDQLLVLDDPRNFRWLKIGIHGALGIGECKKSKERECKQPDLPRLAFQLAVSLIGKTAPPAAQFIARLCAANVWHHIFVPVSRAIGFDLGSH
jgi:hypothetical protein